jgi:pantoate--beta-alanine ligase
MLRFTLQIAVLPTAREVDGLALSSRNVYLIPAERAAAPVVYRSLQAAEALWSKHLQQQGAQSSIASAELLQTVRTELAQEPLISSVDYISVGSRETMAELEAVGAQGAVLSIALRLGGVRLIDNIVLGPP